jgi:APA family basic amino acid/polyamine antiporter
VVVDEKTRLARKLTVTDAVFIGLSAMIGAGIFTALSPAASAAGAGLLIGLVIAACVAFCNANSSAQLARLYPQSGGTYVCATRQLNPLWGWLAGWSFTVGKLASCAAAALTFGYYVWPGQAHLLAALAVVALTAVNYRGVQKTALVTKVLVALVLSALAIVSVTAFAGERASEIGSLTAEGGWRGILESGGILFFAFAGYARIATLGEEVREPRRSIPLAIMAALGITLLIYLGVAIGSLLVVGAEGLAGTQAPLVEVVSQAGFSELAPLVRAGAAIAGLGVLLSLIAGISRTVFAMASDKRLPAQLASVHPKYRVPHVAETTIGAILVITVSFVDLRDAIGFSAFTVLLYYAITNASAWRLKPEARYLPRVFPLLGLIGCVILAFTLPVQSVAVGSGVLAIGILIAIVQQTASAKGPE